MLCDRQKVVVFYKMIGKHPVNICAELSKLQTLDEHLCNVKTKLTATGTVQCHVRLWYFASLYAQAVDINVHIILINIYLYFYKVNLLFKD